MMKWNKGIVLMTLKLYLRTYPFVTACLVLHYTQEIFEGMKAYKRADGRILLSLP